jgi:hypothetical protein
LNPKLHVGTPASPVVKVTRGIERQIDSGRS